MDLEERISKIEERNKRVESDKKWEVSILRRVTIAVLTYLVICVFLYTINETNIFYKALFPVVGFILSTISLRILRKIVKY